MGERSASSVRIARVLEAGTTHELGALVTPSHRSKEQQYQEQEQKQPQQEQKQQQYQE